MRELSDDILMGILHEMAVAQLADVYELRSDAQRDISLLEAKLGARSYKDDSMNVETMAK